MAPRKNIEIISLYHPVPGSLFGRQPSSASRPCSLACRRRGVLPRPEEWRKEDLTAYFVQMGVMYLVFGWQLHVNFGRLSKLLYIGQTTLANESFFDVLRSFA